MQIYAHRGWSRGPGENSLDFFRRAIACPQLDGVEFDIRRDASGQLVVIHDPIQSSDNPPTLDVVLEELRPSSLGLMVEIKEVNLGRDVIATLEAHGVAERSYVFGFRKVASTLPWDEKRSAKLGLISHLPWQSNEPARKYKPDIYMNGYDIRPWTQRLYRTWWSIADIRKVPGQLGAELCAGTARSAEELKWFAKKKIDIATVDLDPNSDGANAKLHDGTLLSKLVI